MPTDLASDTSTARPSRRAFGADQRGTLRPGFANFAAFTGRARSTALAGEALAARPALARLTGFALVPRATDITALASGADRDLTLDAPCAGRASGTALTGRARFTTGTGHGVTAITLGAPLASLASRAGWAISATRANDARIGVSVVVVTI